MTIEYQNVLITFSFLTTMLVGLIFVVFADPFIKKRNKKWLSIIVVSLFTLILQNVADWYLASLDFWTPWRTIFSVFGYAMRPVVLVTFIYISSKDYKYGWILWSIAAVNALVYCTAFFSPVAFSFSQTNAFQRGPLGYTCHIISGVLLVYLVFLSVKECYKVRRAETAIPIFNAVIVVVSIFLDTFSDVYNGITYLTVAMVISSVFYYVWLHLQFVREHEDDLRAQQRIQIMISQIQPHFLYNTLSTIQALCMTDPEKAFSITGKFGVYLRQNLDTIGENNLIPISKELEHTKLYADIEMVRFPNITVEYFVKTDDFCVPALSVQPIVENAIRHGVRIREKGVVSVVVEKAQGFNKIIINDNGKGFDTKAVVNSDEKRSHIGLQNVKDRISGMCGGTLTVDSVIGQGTTVTIMIPETIEKSISGGGKKK